MHGHGLLIKINAIEYSNGNKQGIFRACISDRWGSFTYYMPAEWSYKNCYLFASDLRRELEKFVT